MKTAISMPDEVFDLADRLARQLGISRSQLFVTALREYIATHYHEGLTERINAVCDRVDTNLDPPIRRAQVALLLQEKW